MPKNSICTLADGRFSYQVRDISGKKHEIRSHKNEGIRAFKRRCEFLDRKSSHESHDETLDELFSHWFNDYAILHTSQSYQRNMKDMYCLHVKDALGNLCITDITRAHVYSLLSKKAKDGYSQSTLGKIRCCISAPYNWAVNSLGYDIIPPTQGLRFSRRKDKKKRAIHHALTDEELERFFKAAKGSKYENYFKVLFLTGLRPSECLGLQIKDITADELHIRRAITMDGISTLKTASAKRDLILFDKLKKVLFEQREKVAFLTHDGWLFPSKSGKPSMNAVKFAFQAIIRNTGVYERGGRNHMKKLSLIVTPIRCTLYDFRHTYATRMAESGMNPTALKALVGHADIKTTLKFYIDFTDSMKKDAIDIMENVL